MRYPQICDAIQGLKQLTFTYDGYSRTVNPHAYGVSAEHHELLRAYQTLGGSESGNPMGWKLFRIDEIQFLSVSTSRFEGPHRGYKRNDSEMIQIFCQL